MPLEKYYKEDGSFEKLARFYDEEWEKCDFKQELLAVLNENLDMAVIVYGSLGEYSLKWMARQVPVLDGITPTECLKSKNGIKRLKECLLRFPC